MLALTRKLTPPHHSRILLDSATIVFNMGTRREDPLVFRFHTLNFVHLQIPVSGASRQGAARARAKVACRAKCRDHIVVASLCMPVSETPANLRRNLRRLAMKHAQTCGVTRTFSLAPLLARAARPERSQWRADGASGTWHGPGRGTNACCCPLDSNQRASPPLQCVRARASGPLCGARRSERPWALVRLNP